MCGAERGRKMTERLGIIDLGSNSARLVIFEIALDHSYIRIHEQKSPLRLSEGMGAEKILQASAIARTLETLRIFKAICRRYQVNRLIPVATAAVRNAQNGEELVAKIREDLGLEFRILSGVEEANYGFLGALNTFGESEYLLFDLGGGSIELTWVAGRQVRESISLPFGVLTLTEKWGCQDQLKNSKCEELFKELQKEWQSVGWLKEARKLPLIGTGGTVRNLAKLAGRRQNYPFEKLHNYRFSGSNLSELWEEISRSELKERKKWAGLSENRADLIVAGAATIVSLAEYLKSPEIIVSESGIREGLLFEFIGAEAGDILSASVKNLGRFYRIDEECARRVMKWSDSLFKIFKEPLNLGDREQRFLGVAAYLCEIGKVIHPCDYTRHSGYLLENSNLYGISHSGQIFCVALLMSRSGAGWRQIRRRYGQFLEKEAWEKAVWLGIFLEFAEVLERWRVGECLEVCGEAVGDEVSLKIYSVQRPEGFEFERILKSFRKEMGLKIQLEFVIDRARWE